MTFLLSPLRQTGPLTSTTLLASGSGNVITHNAANGEPRVDGLLATSYSPVSIGDVSAAGQEHLPEVLKRTLPLRFAANGHYYTDAPLGTEPSANRKSYDLGTNGKVAERKLAALMNDPAAGLNFVSVGGRVRQNDFGLGEQASREPRPRLTAEEWRNKVLSSVDGLPPVIKDFSGMFLGAGLKLGGELVFTAEALGEVLAPLIGRLTKDDASWAQFINSNFAGSDPANTALRKLFTLGGRPIAEGADPKFLTAVMLVALKRGGTWAANTTPAQAAAGLGNGIKSLLKDELKTLDPSRYPPGAMGGYIGTVLGSLATFWLPAAQLGLSGLKLLAGGAKLAKQLMPGMLKAAGKKLQLAANQLAALGTLKKAGKLSLPEGRRREALSQAVQKAAQAAEAGDGVGFSRALREVDMALHAAKSPAPKKTPGTKAAGNSTGASAGAGESAAARQVHGQPPPNEIKQVVQKLDDAREAFKRAPSPATHAALKQAWRDVMSFKSDARWTNKDAKRLFLSIVKDKHGGVAAQNAVAKPWNHATPAVPTARDPLSGVALGDEFFSDGKAAVGGNGKSIRGNGKGGNAPQSNRRSTETSKPGTQQKITREGEPQHKFQDWPQPPSSQQIPRKPTTGTITKVDAAAASKATQALAPELSQLLQQTEVLLQPGNQLLYEVKRLRVALKGKGPLSPRDTATLNQLQWRASVQSTLGELNNVLGSVAQPGSGDWRKRVNGLTAKLESLARQGAQAGWGKDASQLVRYLAPNGALQGQIATKERLKGGNIEQGINGMADGESRPAPAAGGSSSPWQIVANLEASCRKKPRDSNMLLRVVTAELNKLTTPAQVSEFIAALKASTEPKLRLITQMGSFSGAVAAKRESLSPPTAPPLTAAQAHLLSAEYWSTNDPSRLPPSEWARAQDKIRDASNAKLASLGLETDSTKSDSIPNKITATKTLDALREISRLRRSSPAAGQNAYLLNLELSLVFQLAKTAAGASNQKIVMTGDLLSALEKGANGSSILLSIAQCREALALAKLAVHDWEQKVTRFVNEATKAKGRLDVKPSGDEFLISWATVIAPAVVNELPNRWYGTDVVEDHITPGKFALPPLAGANRKEPLGGTNMPPIHEAHNLWLGRQRMWDEYASPYQMQDMPAAGQFLTLADISTQAGQNFYFKLSGTGPVLANALEIGLNIGGRGIGPDQQVFFRGLEGLTGDTEAPGYSAYLQLVNGGLLDPNHAGFATVKDFFKPLVGKTVSPSELAEIQKNYQAHILPILRDMNVMTVRDQTHMINRALAARWMTDSSPSSQITDPKKLEEVQRTRPDGLVQLSEGQVAQMYELQGYQVTDGRITRPSAKTSNK
jgi:hypothetical protein